MTGSLVRLAHALARRDRIVHTFIVAGLVAVMAGSVPVAAADETVVPSTGAPVAEERVPSEYSTSLIAWDAVDGTYRSGEEEGSFAFLISLPEATGWELVTILAEIVDRDDGRRPGSLGRLPLARHLSTSVRAQLRSDGVAQRSWAASGSQTGSPTTGHGRLGPARRTSSPRSRVIRARGSPTAGDGVPPA